MDRTLSASRLAALLGDFPRRPAYRGLRQALQELIADGRIAIGARLPSERDAARALAVSRNTVTRAYGELADSGFAHARIGAGTYAAAPLERRRAHDHALRAAGPERLRAGAIDLNCAAGAAAPGTTAAYARALAALPAYLTGDGYLPSGLPALQALIAAGYAGRGLPTRPGQIVVTSGALSALSIVARALTRPGQRILVESPVYANAIAALRLGGARLVPAPLGDPLGEDGWDLDGIAASLRQAAPHFAYLVPDFQNPTGFLMSAQQRARIAALLRAAGAVPIVDETLQTTHLCDAPMPPPFAAHAADAITVGSASKLCWGGLRVGWIRAPQALVETLVRTRVQLDLGTSLFDQLVVAELLADPGLPAVRRAQLRQRRDALAGALRTHLPDWRFRLPDGGLSLWTRLPHGSATRLAGEAERGGVHLAPGPVFHVGGGGDQWLRLPFARPPDELAQAVERIARVWTGLSPRAPARRHDGVLIV